MSHPRCVIGDRALSSLAHQCIAHIACAACANSSERVRVFASSILRSSYRVRPSAAKRADASVQPAVLASFSPPFAFSKLYSLPYGVSSVSFDAPGVAGLSLEGHYIHRLHRMKAAAVRYLLLLLLLLPRDTATGLLRHQSRLPPSLRTYRS